MCKRYIAGMSVILLMIVLTATFGLADRHPMDFDEAIIKSPNIVIGRLEHREKGSVDYEFSIVEQLKGSIQEDRITVTMTSSGEWGDDTEKLLSEKIEEYFTIGSKYILVLSTYTSVYYTQYWIVADIYIPLDEENNILQMQMWPEKIIEEELNNTKEFKIYITEKLENNTKYVENEFESILKYTESDRIEDIVRESHSITRVKIINESRRMSFRNTNLFNCSVLEVYKGIITDEYIDIVLFMDEVEVGGEYVLLMNNRRNLYWLSSINSTVPISDQEKIEEIKALIEAQRIYGDVNNDGEVTNVDLILFKGYIAGILVDDFHLDEADVNGDGQISNVDIILLARYLSGIIVELGP